MATDIIVIPTDQKIVWTMPNLFILAVNFRPVIDGINQYVIPKKVSMTVESAVPAGINKIMPIKGARKRTSFQGIFLTQPKIPFAPNSRPLISNVANNENAVISDGITTRNVKITCKYFQKGSIPGSVN